MIHLVAAFLLAGTITGANPVASIRSGDRTFTVKVGGDVGGWIVRRIEQGRVTLERQSRTLILRDKDSVSESGVLERGIEVNGNVVTLSPEVHRWIKNEGKMKLVMDATATRVDGGYKIWNFDPGSVYDLVGLQNADVVTAIDGVALGSPLEAVQQLLAVQNKNAFTVTLHRGGALTTIEVRVSGSPAAR